MCLDYERVIGTWNGVHVPQSGLQGGSVEGLGLSSSNAQSIPPMDLQ